MSPRKSPSAIALPARLDVAALSTPSAFDRWKAGVRAAGDVSPNTITIYDVIGEDFWTGGGVTVNRIDAALRQIGDQPVEVHINSPGGDMFEGIAIFNRLRQHTAGVTVKVMGLAASAASIIAMAGDEILIGRAAFLMIHNCWVLAMGNRHELEDVAAQLAPFDAAMTEVYAARSGLPAKDIAAMMDAETWLNGSQAIDKGLADGLLEDGAVTEDADKTDKAKNANAIRQAELSLCKSMSRSAARDLLAKIKGTPGAARDDEAEGLDPPTPGAGADDWTAGAAQLLKTLTS